MRVKIKTSDVESGKLEFGKTYGIDIVGASCWLEFVFTRKKRQRVALVCPDGSREYSFMSKKEIKQMIRDEDLVRFMYEDQR